MLTANRTQLLLVAVLVFSAFGLGGLVPSVLVLCSVCAFASAVLVVRAGTEQTRWFLPALVPLALALYTLLQLVPLPLGVLTTLAPQNARIWANALKPFGEGPPVWATLTADRGATLIEGLKWLAYTAVLVTATSVGAQRGVAWGARLVFLLAVSVAVVTFVHGLIGAHRVYGFYQPTFAAARWRVGPLLNPNSLAGYLNVGLLCGMGSMLSRRPKLPRIVFGLGVAVLLGVVFLSGSRAGVVSAVCGIALLAAGVQRIHRNAPGSRRKQVLLLSLAGVSGGAVVLAWLGSTRDSTNALFDKNIEKLDVLWRTRPMLADYAVFGVGRGAFESTFPAYHVSHENVIYAHAENFPVQWIAEWGFPVGLIAIGCLLWMLYPTRLGANRSVTAAGLWAGLVALALQNLLDLGFEVPAVAFEAVACIGFAWGDRCAQAAGEVHEPAADAPWFRRLIWVGAALGVGLAIATLSTGRMSDSRDRMRLRSALMTANLRSADDLSALRGALREATLRHPAEPYFFRVGGVLAWASHRESPIPWVERALERGPGAGSTHFELARILAARGLRSQAFFEFGLATEYTPDLMRRTAPIVASMSANLDDALRAVPDGAIGTRFLVAIARQRRPEFLGDLREGALMEAIRREPDLEEPRMMMARDLMDSLAGRRDTSKCQGERRPACVAWVNEQIVYLAKTHNAPSRATLLLSELWLALGRARDAEQLLAKQCTQIEPELRDECGRLRIRAASATGSGELLANAVGEVAANGCAAGAACGQVFSSLGRELERAGRWAGALAYYRRAVSEDASDARWADVARAANALGDFRLAADAVSRLSNRHPEDSDLRDRHASAERRLLPEVLRRLPNAR